MRVAVLDLGSLSFRLVVAEADKAGRIFPLSKKRAVLNLGLVVGREGRIPEPFATDAVNTVLELRAHAQSLGAERLIPIATSALRDADNRSELATRLRIAAGGPIRFLTGEEEAQLTFTALRAGFELGDQTILGLDLGGGSLELVVGNVSALDLVESIPLGAARLMGAFARHDPMKAKERNRLRLNVERTLLDVVSNIRLRGPQRFLAAGGTVKAIARIIAADRERQGAEVHGMFLGTDELARLRDGVVKMSRSKRARLRGARSRAEVLPAGAIVLASVASMLGADGLEVSEWGLREGMILRTLGWEGLGAGVGESMASSG
jgi:exopolyphosphatase/guanosine-5'-triphosphate,3'-diphosphate pyrophosphatase